MVNETTVRSFLTLVRVGSFTEAAKRLFLSQQAVSTQVAKLEQDLFESKKACSGACSHIMCGCSKIP